MMRTWDRCCWSGAVLSVMAMLTSFVVFGSPSSAAEEGALVPLPADVKERVEQYLPGVIGDPVPAFTLEPSLAPLRDKTKSFKVLTGDNKGKNEQNKISQGKKPGQWRFNIGERTMFLEKVDEHTFATVSEIDRDQGVLTRYNPPQPLLVSGMNAGDKKTVTIAVSVYDLDDPSDLEYSGELDLTFTYVGAYKVTVPAGTLDAALLRWQYTGKVGPATIEDTQVMLFNPDAGIVAFAEKLDVAAMLIYSDNTKKGKVLVSN